LIGSKFKPIKSEENKSSKKVWQNHWWDRKVRLLLKEKTRIRQQKKKNEYK